MKNLACVLAMVAAVGVYGADEARDENTELTAAQAAYRVAVDRVSALQRRVNTVKGQIAVAESEMLRARTEQANIAEARSWRERKSRGGSLPAMGEESVLATLRAREEKSRSTIMSLRHELDDMRSKTGTIVRVGLLGQLTEARAAEESARLNLVRLRPAALPGELKRQGIRLTLANGEEMAVTMLLENGDEYMVKSLDGKTHSIKKSDVKEIDR